MSQSNQILKHLKKHKFIDPITAIKKYLIMRLAARIFDLKELGYDIKTIRVVKNKKVFAVYELKQTT